MRVIYDLWDLETANLIAEFATEDEALAAVRELIELNGSSYADALSLGYANETGEGGNVASDRALVTLALGISPVRS